MILVILIKKSNSHTYNESLYCEMLRELLIVQELETFNPSLFLECVGSNKIAVRSGNVCRIRIKVG